MRFGKLASLLCVALSALALSTSAIAQTQPAPPPKAPPQTQPAPEPKATPQTQPAPEPKAPPQTQPAPEPKGPPVPVCAGCHEQPHASIAMTAHGANNDASGSMCQACHGDATEHLKDPVKNKPANLIKYGTAAEKAAVCFACHSTNRQLAFWESGKHSLNDVACSNCHNIHGKQGNPTIAPFTTTFRPNESEVCGTCHQDIRSQTLKPFHHPIVEGKVKCSDCHNPHGAISTAMLRSATVNDQCVSCHADKRGPFVFSHPPVEENCTTCHNPHGSSHDRLLNEPAPNLCQDCHDAARHPGTIYGGGAAWLTPGGSPNSSVNTRFIARGCVNCHNAIHGSNAPGFKGRTFLR